MGSNNNLEERERPELRRVLGLQEAVALGIGGTIGGGVFVLVGVGAGLAGPGMLLAFLLAFCAAAMIALPYTELACRFPEAGGAYVFARAILGQAWGFLAGWGYWGAYLFISGYVTLGFGGYLHALSGLPSIVGAVALTAAIAALNLAGVKVSGRTQAIIVLLAILVLVGFGLLGLPHLRARNFTPFLPRGVSGVAEAALLAFLAFGGFDMVAAAAEEIERPARNLPLAILITLGAILGIYLLVALVASGVLPWQTLGASTAPLADSAAAFLGPFGRWLVSGAALLTTAATANAILLTTSRISFAMARDHLLPLRLAVVHRATGVPYIAVILNALLFGMVAVAGSIRLAAVIGGFLYVVQFSLALGSLLILRRQSKERSAFQTPWPSLVLPLAGGACLFLLASSSSNGILGGVAWLLAGLLVYRGHSLLHILFHAEQANR